MLVIYGCRWISIEHPVVWYGDIIIALVGCWVESFTSIIFNQWAHSQYSFVVHSKVYNPLKLEDMRWLLLAESKLTDIMSIMLYILWLWFLRKSVQIGILVLWCWRISKKKLTKYKLPQLNIRILVKSYKSKGFEFLKYKLV